MVNHTLQRTLFRTGTLLAALAVILGAFGKHALKELITEKQVELFETGVRYQFLHALALLILATLIRNLNESTLRNCFRLFIAGIIIFSGGMYLLSTSAIWYGEQLNVIGAILPIGGLCFIGSWLLLAFKGYRYSEKEPGV